MRVAESDGAVTRAPRRKSSGRSRPGPDRVLGLSTEWSSRAGYRRAVSCLWCVSMGSREARGSRCVLRGQRLGFRPRTWKMYTNRRA